MCKNGKEYNYRWIKENKNHWLAMQSTMMKDPDLFISTCCEITALMIRSKITSSIDWELIEFSKFSEIHKKHKLFQVSIGEDWTSCDHIFTIFENYIIQSYYGKYSVVKELITDDKKNAIDNINLSNSYNVITQTNKYPDVNLNPKFLESRLNIFYWIPK